MKQASLLLFLLIAAAVGFGLWSFLGESGDSALADTAGAAVDPAGDPSALVPGRAGAGPGELVGDAGGELENRSLARTTDDGTPGAAATFVTGRVRLPEDLSPDPTLEVFVVEGPLGYRRLARHLDRGGEVGGPLHGRATVEPDGTFRVRYEPEPGSVGKVSLMVRGRHLYSSTARTFAPGSEIVLEPEVGAWFGGSLVPPAESEGSLAGIDLNLRAAEGGQIAPGQDGPDYRTRVETDEEGAFAFRAVPVGDYYLAFAPDDFAAAREDVQGLVAGKDTRRALQLLAGGTIRGQVTDADTGQPIAEAEVRALLGGRWFGFDDFEVRETETGADGTFTLAAVTPGPVKVRAEADGRLESGDQKLEVTDRGQVEGVAIELSRGESIAGRVLHANGTPAAGANVDVDFDPAYMAGMGAFNMLRGAESDGETDAGGNFVVTGLGKGPFVVSAHAPPPDGSDDDTPHRARADGVAPGTRGLELRLAPPRGLFGRVVDADGEPITVFRVEVAREVDSSFGTMRVDDRSASFQDEDGHFFLDDVPQGRWNVFAEAQGYVAPEPATIDMPATTESDRLTITLVPGATVRGRVLSPTGMPVPGAKVSLETSQPAWQMAMGGGPRAPSTLAGEEGTFELLDVPPGSIGLFAEAEGYARSGVSALEIESGALLEDVELSLSTGGTLTGEIYTKDGEKGSGFMITLNNMETFDTVLAAADTAGTFRFENLAAGTYQVVGMNRQADFRGESDSDTMDMGDMLGSMEFSQATIRDGETTHVVLGAPPANPVRVHGRVEHGDEPYRGALISFYPEGGKIYERVNFTTIEDDGTYEVTVDGSGNYVVNVQKIAGGAGQQNTIEFAEEVPEGDACRIDFEIPLGRISGRVVDARGDPVGGTRVSLGPDGPGRSDSLFGGQYTEIVTESDGTYDIEGLRPGTYRVSAGGASFLALGEEARAGRVTRGGVRLAENEWKQDFDIELPAPGTLEVRVRGADGQPVASASVFVRDAEGRFLEVFSLNVTDGTGKCRYTGLAPGEYTVIARAQGQASSETGPARVSQGETQKIDVDLEDGTILWIKLVGGDGEGARAAVRVSDSDGREVTGMFSMQDLQALYVEGSFSPTEHRLGPLPPGRYRVTAETNDGQQATKPVTLRGEPERKLTVRLKAKK